MRVCEYCGRSIVYKNAQARYCSDKHRTYARRAKAKAPIPAAMLEQGRWIRWTPIIRKGRETKMPLTISGTAASSTDPTTWSTHLEAKESNVGIGLGYVLGDGIGCIDLDHCLDNGTPTSECASFLEQYRGHFIEVSPSGDGLHIWGLSDEGPGSKRTINGLSIERYSVGRYITITGNVYQHGELLPL